MDSLIAAGAAILLVLAWYGLIRLAGHLRPCQWRGSVVWCAPMKCISLIETEPAPGTDKNSLTVCHCLLWPELNGCDQRCIH